MFFILKIIIAATIVMLMVQTYRMSKAIDTSTPESTSIIGSMFFVLLTPVRDRAYMSPRKILRYYHELLSGKMLSGFREHLKGVKTFSIECPFELREVIIKDFSHQYLILDNTKIVKSTEELKSRLTQQSSFLIALLDKDVEKLIRDPENQEFYAEEPVAFSLICGVADVAKKHKVGTNMIVAVSLAYIQEVNLDAAMNK